MNEKISINADASVQASSSWDAEEMTDNHMHECLLRLHRCQHLAEEVVTLASVQSLVTEIDALRLVLIGLKQHLTPHDMNT